MKALSHLLIPVLLPCMVHAQTLKEVFRVDGACDMITSDELRNLYILKDNTLQQFDLDGNARFSNSLRQFGRITSIDATFAMRPMVFSQGQAQIAQLDNTLSVQGSTLDLRQGGFGPIGQACSSIQNAFWVFDERELSISRVDNQLRVISSTGRLDQLLGHTVHPTSMQEWDNRLYVNDPTNGVLVFDLFGTYVKTLPIKGASQVEVRAGSLFSFANGSMQRYDMLTFGTETISLPEGLLALEVRVEKQRIFVRTADAVIVYATEN